MHRPRNENRRDASIRSSGRSEGRCVSHAFGPGALPAHSQPQLLRKESEPAAPAIKPDQALIDAERIGIISVRSAGERHQFIELPRAEPELLHDVLSILL